MKKNKKEVDAKKKKKLLNNINLDKFTRLFSAKEIAKWKGEDSLS